MAMACDRISGFSHTDLTAVISSGVLWKKYRNWYYIHIYTYCTHVYVVAINGTLFK